MSQPWIDIALTWAAPTAAWMLTYLLHSTVLLGLAAAATLVLRERRPALQEVVWKCALVGGIATATLQLGAGWTPLAGAWELPGVAEVEAAADEPLQREESTGTAAANASPAIDRAAALDVDREPLAVTAGERLAAARAANEVESASLPLVESAATTATGGALGTASEAAATSPAPAFSAWPLLAVAAWLAFAAVFAARLGADYLRLAVRLRERWPVADGAVAALFGRLLGRSGRRRPVSLSGSERLPVPIAWGLARPEVSLPARVLSDLSPYHQESILAHELAHVLRRDPAWLAAARAIEAALFFQPLNRVARRRLAELAEVHCDDRAVELTGKPLELARCLTEVAAWRLTGVAALPVPSMASGSSLGRRVRRLVDGERGERLPRWVRPAAAVAVLAVALAAPGITRGKPTPQEPADEPVATEPIGEPAAAAAAEPDNAGWVIVDGDDVRSWDDLTPEERERVRRQVAEARVHAQRAGVEAREALRAALDGLRQRRETLGADGGREALEAAR
ncbi:MAG TPA: M56 family metallopeptidase, partial [Thermoanaerobaculia bacterium]|nr:M56 family metallopeptidase [Thermoanaerobaculia bacterium]